MAEIYKNTNTAVSTKLYVDGEPVYSDTTVNVYFYDITEDPLVNPPIDKDDVVFDEVAIQSEVDIGVYKVYIPINESTRNRNFKVQWIYSYNSKTYYHYTYLDVVTPYISIEEAIEDLGLGSDANDPNHKSYHDLRMAEKYARKMVEYYTGQKFFLFDDTFTIMGNDSDTLPLPRKLNSLHSLYQNDQLWVDNLNQVNNLGYVLEPTTSGFGIKINQSSLLDNDVYIANGMVPPSIHDVSPNIFKRGKQYKVYGRFGWKNVPDEVEQATIEIMRSYFSKDRVWKDRYVNKISTTDWDFQYTSDAFTGTGSAYADKLLLDYVVTQMVVV
jgi:hypothetical protein